MDSNDSSNKKNASAESTMVLVKAITTKLMDEVEEGGRITIKDTIDKVVAATGIQVSIANGLVPLYMHEHADAGWGTINNGRNGGAFRGGKKPRIDPRPRCESCNQVIRPKKNDQ